MNSTGMPFKRKSRVPSNHSITLMAIPEKSHRVHKVIIPVLWLKVGAVLFSLFAVFIVIVGLEYVTALGEISENQRLKGENFKLRQEMLQVKNKVQTMEGTLDRMRNYAKKLQILMGQTEKLPGELPQGPMEESTPSLDVPAVKEKKVERKPTSLLEPIPQLRLVSDQLGRLQESSLPLEVGFAKLENNFLARRSWLRAMPSILPVAGWITSGFGYRNHPQEGGYRLHAGVDVAADPGTPVRAPADGTVLFSGYKEGYGKLVILNHGYGISTVFAHNSKLFVTASTKVKRGDILSEVGSTGMSTGPHLHYEIRKNGVPVNPLSFFARAHF